MESKANSEHESRPAGADVEVTPEMIEAGLEELSYFNPSEDPPEAWSECVASIYRAMELVVER